MKNGSRSNALLVELLIVVTFFMLASTVLLEVFAAARKQSGRAGELIHALNGAQSLADRLYAAEDPEGALLEAGGQWENGLWRIPGEEYDLTVSMIDEPRPSGALRRWTVRAEIGGETLVELPAVRYREAAP